MGKQYELLIFDLDGTLVDSAPDIVATIQYIIEKYGFEPKDNAFIQNCIGGGARNLLLKSLGQDQESLIDFEILEVFKAYYLKNCDVYTVLYPGVKNTLEYYRQAGKTMAIATYKIRSATEKILKTLELNQYFGCVITADDVGNPKPHPECIQKILEYHKISPEEAILIGDTKTDYMTGHNAGIDVCAVTSGYGAKDVLEDLQPTYLVGVMDEIKDFIV